MKKFISAVTSLAMAATMASSIAPSISAADATKTFSLKAFAEAGSKYDAMGDKVTISKADIAAGDVVVPCAVYLDEATNDTETMSVQFTINSDSADVKNVKFDCFLPVDDYFAEEKEFKVGDASVKTKKYAAFAGEYDDILEEYSAAGKSVAGCDPSQDVAGAKNYFIGYSWTNNGSAYKWLGSKSTDHPVVVFNVTFPKGTAAGDYKIQYCKYNTDTKGIHNNPSNMIETKQRYTEELGNLKLNEMTITVEGDAAVATTTTKAPETTTTTIAQATTTTSKKDDTPATTTTVTPAADGDVIFDFGNYKTKAGEEKLKIDVKADTKGAPVSAMDVVFKIDSPLKITNFAKNSQAVNQPLMSNMENLGASFTSVDSKTGEPVVPDKDKAVFTMVVSVPSDTPDGIYKIGFGDKCEVFKDGTSFQYKTAAINGNITVGEVKDTETTTTKAPEVTTTAKPAVTTTTSKKDDTPATTTTTKAPDTSNADVVFDFGSYKTKAGEEKLKIDVKADTKGSPVSAMDVLFKIDSPLKITNFAKNSQAVNQPLMSNMENLGASFTSVDSKTGEPVVPDKDKAVFTMVVSVPSDTPDGVYHIGFGDKCEVFKDGTSFQYKTAAINGDITVGEVKDTETTTTKAPDVTTTTATTTKNDTTVTTTTNTGDGKTYAPKWGDVNCDGDVNVADVVLLNKYINKNSDYAITDQGKVNADVYAPQNTDEKVAVDPSKTKLTLEDSEAILQAIVHLIKLPKNS